jgi:hypothetical protein
LKSRERLERGELFVGYETSREMQTMRSGELEREKSDVIVEEM